MDLSEVSTKDIIAELQTRKGVEITQLLDRCSYTVETKQEPATVIVVRG